MKLQPAPFPLQAASPDAPAYFAKLAKRVEIANQADASASSVAVSSADASDLATAITLVNELKADLTQLVSDYNALVTAYNALLAAMQTAETMDS